MFDQQLEIFYEQVFRGARITEVIYRCQQNPNLYASILTGLTFRPEKWRGKVTRPVLSFYHFML